MRGCRSERYDFIHAARNKSTSQSPQRVAAYAAGKRMVRAYLESGTRVADKVVDEVGP